VGINIGQNLQALAIHIAGTDKNKCKSKMWVIGMATFAVSSVITFGALALAAASVLVPLESVQFVVNILFNKFVRKKKITLKMWFGVLLIMLGILLFVLFGPNEGVCFTEPEMRAMWGEPVWWVFLILTFSTAAISYVVWRRYAAARAAGKPLPRSGTVEPAAYTLSAALFGGGQMIVHTKMLAELLELSFGGGGNALANWFFWLELVLVLIFGPYWLFRLTQCLGYYDPLFIIPLMQTAFIVFGAVAGGIYFQEFALMQYHPWVGSGSYVLYAIGLFLAIGGLCLIASSVPPPDAPNADSRAKTAPRADGKTPEGEADVPNTLPPSPPQATSAWSETTLAHGGAPVAVPPPTRAEAAPPSSSSGGLFRKSSKPKGGGPQVVMHGVPARTQIELTNACDSPSPSAL